MEQGDVPVGCHVRQERDERARSLGKLEAEDPLVVGQRGATANEMPKVQLGQFVVGEVERFETRRLERSRDLVGLVTTRHLQSHEDIGLVGVGDPVVELGDRTALADRLDEAPKAAPCLGNRHGEHRLAVFTDLGSLGDEAQTIEVHVRATGDGHEGLAGRARAFDV